MKFGGAHSAPQRETQLDLEAPLRGGEGNGRAGKGRKGKKKREGRAEQGMMIIHQCVWDTVLSW